VCRGARIGIRQGRGAQLCAPTAKRGAGSMRAVSRTEQYKKGDSPPPGWVRTTVREIFTVAGGGTPSTAKAEFWNGSIPWITSADIDDQGKIHPRKKITAKAIAESATS
jgi:hypothetical protein